MPAKPIDHNKQKARAVTELTRQTLLSLPTACSDFIRAIAPHTSALTRLAYAQDLRLFFRYLSAESPKFANYEPDQWTDAALDQIQSRDIEMFLDYLTLYQRTDDKTDESTEFTNAELGKMRKLSTLRSLYKYLFKNSRVTANVAVLVDMPKRHEKPILRLEIDEVAKLLDMVESGTGFTERQNAYNQHTNRRDFAMLTLFLGTGIRVSECVGMDIHDIDFRTESFLVTRKGGNQAILYFPEEVTKVMKDYIKWRMDQEALPGHEQALFLSLQKKRIGVRAVEMMVKKYAMLVAPLKSRMSPHKLRSTFGTNLYRETGDIYVVADVLGHSDVNTTRRHYADMSDERRRMAAKSVKLRDDE